MATTAKRTIRQLAPSSAQAAHDAFAQHTGLKVRCFDSIEARPVSWLWPKFIARGKLTLIAGQPGLGKSQLMALFSAVVTSGKTWPLSEEICEVGDVAILSAEDDPADTIKPRLIAAGADVKRCHIIETVRDGYNTSTHNERQFDFCCDLRLLDIFLSNNPQVKLVIIDPITAYQKYINPNQSSEVRQQLSGLVTIAERHNVAMLGITHLNKAEKLSAMSRIMGSGALVAAVRAAYIVVANPDEPEERFFLPVKNNIGIDNTGFSFSIEPKIIEGGLETSQVIIADGVDDAQNVIRKCFDNSQPRKASKTAIAAQLITTMLKDGERPVVELYGQAEKQDISVPTVRLASKRLPVSKRKDSKGSWFWNLGEIEPED